jgi:hypothetical protein
VRAPVNDPMAAGIISAVAGVVGFLPIALTKRKDAVGIFQLALVGTVLHLFAAVALTGAAVGTHAVALRMDFIYWILGGYWVSLILLILQLRQRLIGAMDISKGPATI